ncbi:LytTR family DNA-binding domain-containing protein [Algoriphagus sp. AGSA1]|uniref:LytR/AlgR family response regulator transcription factor n=1 Tax=Algoriphagus sp. AGSA1 TaxID=2907213 RepID=UPI001F367C29|nr:LytTR family DNA-binding domain-containing protein [Algoriphagus sp. AGSA1]MCE7054250.1 LytTR family DNA-binding domain-containing protein [Algoriphagus sp. AGSA1]
MVKAVIIEDEHIASNRLAHLVAEVASDIKVVTTLSSVESGTRWFKENPLPDLIFLDIQLNDGYGFDILDTLGEHPPVIFTTAYNEYAIRGFKYNGLDYLLKPIEKKDLERALDKYRISPYSKVVEDTKIQDFKSLFKKEYKHRFMVKIGNHYGTFNVDDIHYFKSENGSISLFTVNGKNYPIEYSIDQLEKILNPIEFFRINRKYMVALKAVQEIHNYFNSRLLLKLRPDQEEKVIVARERSSEFKKWLDM